MDETILTAANDQAHGGLLSIQTIQAANLLEQQITIEEAKAKKENKP